MQQKLKETAGHPTCTLVTQFIDAWLAQSVLFLDQTYRQTETWKWENQTASTNLEM